jgi:predicted ATP-grasp superfamily ATP-dependent carboligase
MSGISPAIVMCADTPIGLAAIRDLAEHGVPVICLVRAERGVGRFARGVVRWDILPREDDAALALLLRCAAETGASILIPVGERDALWTRSQSDAGALPGLSVLTASAENLRIANDKRRTYEFARRIGLAVPRTWSPLAADAVLEGLRFPVITKWADPQAVAARLENAGLTVEKCRYFFDEPALRAHLRQFAPFGVFPIVQEYAPGHGIGQMVLARDGEVLCRFEHERLAEWPPTGGTSSACRAVALSAHPDLFAKTDALIAALGWTGVAMVEYRLDPATGRAVLMEINGRFWGSLPLAHHAGMPFGWLLYRALGLGEAVAQPAYRAGTRCFYLVPEAKRLLAVLRERDGLRVRLGGRRKFAELAASLARFLAGVPHFYVVALRDPMPALADAGYILRRIWRMVSRSG